MTFRRIFIGYDPDRREIWFVDSVDKLPAAIAFSIPAPARDLNSVKALVCDTERAGEYCVADVDGWRYSTKKARRLE